MRLPMLLSVWTKDGWLSSIAPTAEIIQTSADEGRHTRLRGFRFEGPGWYPRHRVLVTSAGEDLRGTPTFELRFYVEDPRPHFRAVAELATRDLVLDNKKEKPMENETSAPTTDSKEDLLAALHEIAYAVNQAQVMAKTNHFNECAIAVDAIEGAVAKVLVNLQVLRAAKGPSAPTPTPET